MTVIDPISQNNAPGGAVQTQSASRTGALNLNENFDTFLNLLTAQLRNQDPLDPTDPTEFVAQLTQFSQLEQSVAQTQALEEIAALQRGGSAYEGLDFLGRQVEAASGAIALQSGEASFDYDVTAPGETMAVRIYDDTGDLVASLDAQTAVGRHAITWDGKADNGTTAADGIYRVELVALDGEEARPAGQIVLVDSVDELRFFNGGAELKLASGVSVAPGAVLSVMDRPADPPAAP